MNFSRKIYEHQTGCIMARFRSKFREKGIVASPSFVFFTLFLV